MDVAERYVDRHADDAELANYARSATDVLSSEPMLAENAAWLKKRGRHSGDCFSYRAALAAAFVAASDPAWIHRHACVAYRKDQPGPEVILYGDNSANYPVVTAFNTALEARAAFSMAGPEHASVKYWNAAHWYWDEEAAELGEQAEQAALLRDLFGNPFRLEPAVDPSWQTWRVGAIVKLAQAIYDERRFDDLPILADALEEAGCTNQEILQHCRQKDQVHVRGCWVVDLLLEKS